MKKLIGIVFISLMFANIGYAEMTLIEEKRRLHGRDINWNIMSVCIDGYKFVKKILNIPNHDKMTDQQVEYVSDKIYTYYK